MNGRATLPASVDQWVTQRQELNQILRVVLVGCGAVANVYYAPALQELEKNGKLKVTALVDPDGRNLAKIHNLFPWATCLSTIDAVIERDYDLAIVASPPYVHAEQTMQLLQAGVAVLCEKPMATSAADARAMIACAAVTHQMLAIGLVRRFFPATQMIHSLLAQNVLGPVRSFTFHEGDPFSWPAQSASFFQREAAKGGVLLDIGVHVLDLVTWWWGPPVNVRYADDTMGGVEANCQVELTFAQGHSGEVRLSRDLSLSNQLEVHCERGAIRWNVKEVDKVEVAFADTDFVVNGTVLPRDNRPHAASSTPLPATFEQSFLHQLLHVVSVAQGNGEPLVSGVEGLSSLELIERCYRERTLMGMSWLGEDELSRARQLNGAITSW